MPVNIWNIFSLNPLLFQSCKGFLTHFHLCLKVISVTSGLYLLLNSDCCLLSHPANRLFLGKSALIHQLTSLLLLEWSCFFLSPAPPVHHIHENWIGGKYESNYILLPASPLSFSSTTYHPSHWAVTTKERGKYSDVQQWAICASFFVLNSWVCCF